MKDPNRPCTIWFTGLSGAGKTTVSRLVAAHLKAQGVKVEVLDGDLIRENISKGLGFSKEDRDTNIQRIGWICEVLTRNEVFVCAAAISPYERLRQEVRRQIGDFMLVYCNAPLKVLEQRDVKGLYARARRGEIKHLSGVDDPYEAPRDHEVEVLSDGSETPKQSAAKVIRALERQGYLHPSPTSE